MESNDTVPRLVMGYKSSDLQRSGDAFKAHIPKLPNTNVSSEDSGRCIRCLYAKAEASLNEFERRGDDIPKRELEDAGGYAESLHDTAEEIRSINRLINKYGFYVSGHFTSPKLGRVKRNAQKVKDKFGTTLPESKSDYQEAENLIFDGMWPTIWSVERRAEVLAGLFLKVDQLKQFSHLLEQATLSLYRQEPISVMTTLVPVIEGILLSFYGYKPTDPNKPKYHQLLNYIAKQWPKAQNFPTDLNPILYDEYLRCFLWIAENIFFKEAQSAEGNSFFNRHYAVHLMGPENFCSRNNAFKMIALVELLGHIIAVNVDQHELFHTSDDEVIPRRDFYETVAMESFDSLDRKGRFFNEHEYFSTYNRLAWVPLDQIDDWR